jgi:hypothetical protein
MPETRQSAWLAQKVHGRLVASSMEKDAFGVGLHGRLNCRVKRRQRAQTLIRVQVIAFCGRFQTV